MALASPCQTPGAHYEIHTDNRGIFLTVNYGRRIELTEDEATELETSLHNATEQVLAKYYGRPQ